jgi:DNA polymerase IV
MEATILHADLDAFYASVEQLLDPSLRGKPVAVGGGVVLAASYEAKAFGVRSGMSGRRARELCPQLIFVSGHFSEYQRLGDAAIGIVGDFTLLIPEQAAHPFRNDGAPLFRSIAAQGSD